MTTRLYTAFWATLILSHLHGNTIFGWIYIFMSAVALLLDMMAYNENE